MEKKETGNIKVGTVSLVCIFIAYAVTLNTFSVGSAQAGHLSFKNGVIMILIGWVGLAIVGSLSGEVGFLSGGRGPEAFKKVFGSGAYRIPSVLASVALEGFTVFDYWYVGKAFMNLFPSLKSGAFYIGIVFLAAAAILGAIKDISSLKWLTTCTIPIAVILCVIILVVTINQGGGMEVIMNYKPPVEETSIIIGANVMFSCWLSTVPGFMDFTSQSKTRKAVWIAIPIGMFAIAFQYFIGQVGTYVFGISDFTSLSAALAGVSAALGLICNLFTLFAQANTVPATTIMVTSHLNSSLGLPKKAVIFGQPIIAALLSIAMFLGADIGIINTFGTFVGFLFAPLLGAIFAEFYVVGRKKFRSDDELPGISVSGVICIVAGFILGVLFTYVWNIQIPVAMLLLVLCFVLHLFLRKVLHLS